MLPRHGGSPQEVFFFEISSIDIYGNYEPKSKTFSEISLLSGEW